MATVSRDGVYRFPFGSRAAPLANTIAPARVAGRTRGGTTSSGADEASGEALTAVLGTRSLPPPTATQGTGCLGGTGGGGNNRALSGAASHASGVGGAPADKPRTVEEAIAYFLAHGADAPEKFMYLRYRAAPGSGAFRPYDLVVVPAAEIGGWARRRRA